MMVGQPAAKKIPSKTPLKINPALDEEPYAAAEQQGALSVNHHSTGKGRNVSREQNEISFQSLRHTATTLLKSAGVSDAVAREFIGHDSPTVSQQYTHIPTDTLRQAANKLMDIFK
jgi:integrase